MGVLNDRQRRVLLAWLDGMTPKEIADLLETSPETVRKIKERAIKKCVAGATLTGTLASTYDRGNQPTGAWISWSVGSDCLGPPNWVTDKR